MGFFGSKTEPEPQPWVAPTPPTPPAPAPLRYGIGDAIGLFRSLPQGQDGDLVIQVVRTTLASLKVRLPDIIEDAAKRMKHIQERIDQGHGQIAKLEQKLQEHRQEIAAQTADLQETAAVKSRLERAEQFADDKAAVPQPDPQLAAAQA